MPSAWSARFFLYTSPGPAWGAVRCRLSLDSGLKAAGWVAIIPEEAIASLIPLQQLSQAPSVQCYFMYLSYACGYSRTEGHSEENSEKYKTGIFTSYHSWSLEHFCSRPRARLYPLVLSSLRPSSRQLVSQVCRGEAPDRLRCSQASCKKSHSLSWFMKDNQGLGEVKGLSFSSGLSLSQFPKQTLSSSVFKRFRNHF